MDFNKFVKLIYKENAFSDENCEYVKKHIFPFLLPALEKLTILVNYEKEKHAHFILQEHSEEELESSNSKSQNITKEMKKKRKKKTERINIFDESVLKIKRAELYEIQQEILKEYVKKNPILLLREFLLEEYNKQNKIRNDDSVCNADDDRNCSL